ncbi:MAG: AhpC/TSA family protein [Beijerinckiaceae bacterium]|nr:AhpC/TSA family protein [Beijerinckiaceae bacterium]
MQERTLEAVFHDLCSAEWPLRERLEAFSQAVREFGLPHAEAYDDLIARLRACHAGAAAPGPGEIMPGFVLPDSAGHLVSLSSLLQDGPVVISFNRGHWCEYCAIELSALRQALSEIVSHGAKVVSIMPETQEFLAKINTNKSSSFTLLSDVDNSYALIVGLVIWLGDKVRQIYLEHGLHLERYQGSGAWFVPIPATFVVGTGGRIVSRFVDPDFRTRMDVDDILAALRIAKLGH